MLRYILANLGAFCFYFNSYFVGALDEKSPTSRLMAECEAAEIRDVAFAFEQLKNSSDRGKGD